MINGGFVQLPSFVLVRTSPFSNGFMGSLQDGRVIWEAFYVVCQVGYKQSVFGQRKASSQLQLIKKREKSETFPLMFKFIPFSVSAEQTERLVYGERKLKIATTKKKKHICIIGTEISIIVSS